MTDSRAKIVSVHEAMGLSIFAVHREALGTVGYVVVLERTAVVIDPDWQVLDFSHCASALGKGVSCVFETHAHSDRLSGARILKDDLKVEHFLHPYDAVDLESRQVQHMPYEFLGSSRSILRGSGTFEVLHLPGHTLGHCGLLLNGKYLFSGELLSRKGCTPDVGASWELWAGQIYRSLCRVSELSNRVIVLPSRIGCDEVFEARPLGEWRSLVATLGQGRPPEAEFVLRLDEDKDPIRDQLRRRILRINRGLEPLGDPSVGIAIERQLAS